MAPYSSSVIVAQPRVHDLLKKLHELSESQENSFSQRWFYFTRLIKFLLFGQTWSSSADIHMEDKLVALDVEKCQLMYLLARSLIVRNAIEAGTSHGVSTIYLALAVGQNVEHLRRSSGDDTITGKVIGTEKEAAKAVKARENWKAAGSEAEPWIELREGNLLETLKEIEGIPETIDLLLLDIWTPLALPTLKIVKPRFKKGSVVIADNVTMAKALYKEFLSYIVNPQNRFRTIAIPFSGGLEVSVYLPDE